MNLTPEGKGLIDIAKMALAFSRVHRVTLHDDGYTKESDTDHTIMLSLCACALAQKLYSDRLDVGLIAQFALVHDLVEVYAGDTNSINLSEEDRHEKEKREKDSLIKITEQFSHVYPWIHVTIEKYEKLDTPEARFVKILDKAMAKITNTLNHGAALSLLGTTKEEITHHFSTQLDTYTKRYGEEFPEIISLLDELMKNMIYELYAKNS